MHGISVKEGGIC